MSTDALENALQFADAESHEGDVRVCLWQAKSASRTLATEVRRLQHELGVVSQNYVHANERVDRAKKVLHDTCRHVQSQWDRVRGDHVLEEVDSALGMMAAVEFMADEIVQLRNQAGKDVS